MSAFKDLVLFHAEREPHIGWYDSEQLGELSMDDYATIIAEHPECIEDVQFNKNILSQIILAAREVLFTEVIVKSEELEAERASERAQEMGITTSEYNSFIRGV